MFKIYAYSYEDKIETVVETIGEAKQTLLKWNEILDEDYDEMGMINLETKEDFGWLDVVDGCF